MAIVLNTEAGNTVSVNNEMLFVAYESVKAIDPGTYPDYAYVCDVYVDGSMVERLISRPEPTYKRGIFDVSKALQPYATYGFNAGNSAVDYTPRIAYQLKFGEQYNGTLYTNLLPDSTDRYCFGTYKPKPFTSSAVLSATGIASNMPDVVYYNREQGWHTLPFFANVSGISDARYQLRNEAGAILSTTVLSMGSIAAKSIRQFNIGTSVILNEAGVYATIAYPDASTIIKTIRYINDCRFDPKTIVWLNPYGAYDSQSFGLVSKKTNDIVRKDFTQLDYRINPSGVISYQENNVYYGGKRGYYATTKTKMSLTSHLLTDEEYAWLAELFSSPDVYIYDEEKFIPVTITQSSYEHRTYANSKLTPLQFEVEFSTDYNSQLL